MSITEKVVRAFLERSSFQTERPRGVSKADWAKIEPILAKIPIKMDPERAKFMVEQAQKSKPSKVQKLLDEIKLAIGVRVAREYTDAITRLREVAGDDQLLAAVLTVMKHNPEILSS